METVNIAKTIRAKIDVNSSDNIIQLTQDTSLIDLNTRHRIISRNKYLKNLKAFVNITSLPQVDLPDFQLEDSETEKLYKVLDVEWNSDRKQLNLLFGKNNDWMTIGETSLLNPSGYPYRTYNLMDLATDNLALEIGDDAALAVQMFNAGFGLLEGNDVVNIYGSYMEEIVIDDSIESISTVLNNLVPVNARTTLLLPENQNRKYAAIQNNGSNDIYISLSNNADSRGILIRPDGHYEFNTNHVPYYGEISAYSDYNTTVLITEGS